MLQARNIESHRLTSRSIIGIAVSVIPDILDSVHAMGTAEVTVLWVAAVTIITLERALMAQVCVELVVVLRDSPRPTRETSWHMRGWCTYSIRCSRSMCLCMRCSASCSAERSIHLDSILAHAGMNKIFHSRNALRDASDCTSFCPFSSFVPRVRLPRSDLSPATARRVDVRLCYNMRISFSQSCCYWCCF